MSGNRYLIRKLRSSLAHSKVNQVELTLNKKNLFVQVFPLFVTLKDKTSKPHLLITKIMIIKIYNQPDGRFLGYNFQIGSMMWSVYLLFSLIMETILIIYQNSNCYI